MGQTGTGQKYGSQQQRNTQSSHTQIPRSKQDEDSNKQPPEEIFMAIDSATGGGWENPVWGALRMMKSPREVNGTDIQSLKWADGTEDMLKIMTTTETERKRWLETKCNATNQGTTRKKEAKLPLRIMTINPGRLGLRGAGRSSNQKIFLHALMHPETGIIDIAQRRGTLLIGLPAPRVREEQMPSISGWRYVSTDSEDYDSVGCLIREPAPNGLERSVGIGCNRILWLENETAAIAIIQLPTGSTNTKQKDKETGWKETAEQLETQTTTIRLRNPEVHIVWMGDFNIDFAKEGRNSDRYRVFSSIMERSNMRIATNREMNEHRVEEEWGNREGGTTRIWETHKVWHRTLDIIMVDNQTWVEHGRNLIIHNGKHCRQQHPAIRCREEWCRNMGAKPDHMAVEMDCPWICGKWNEVKDDQLPQGWNKPELWRKVHKRMKMVMIPLGQQWQACHHEDVERRPRDLPEERKKQTWKAWLVNVLPLMIAISLTGSAKRKGKNNKPLISAKEKIKTLEISKRGNTKLRKMMADNQDKPPAQLAKAGKLMTSEQTRQAWITRLQTQTLDPGEELTAAQLNIKKDVEQWRTDIGNDVARGITAVQQVSEPEVTDAMEKCRKSDATSPDTVLREYYVIPQREEDVEAIQWMTWVINGAYQTLLYWWGWAWAMVDTRHKKGSRVDIKNWRLLWIPQGWGLLLQRITYAGDASRGTL